MKIYLAGPITGLPHDVARAAFEKAAARLAEAGHTPVNPMNVPLIPGCRCPNAVTNAGSGSGHEWACYMRKDLAALLDCDAIVMLPGWEASHGARLELQVATAAGLPVAFADPATGGIR